MIERSKLRSSFANYQSYRRQLTVLASLGFATALCLGLLALRAWHYGGSGPRLVGLESLSRLAPGFRRLCRL